MFNLLYSLFHRRDFNRFEILVQILEHLFSRNQEGPHKTYLEYFREKLPYLYIRIFTFGLERDRLEADRVLRVWESAGVLNSDEVRLIREEVQRALNNIRYNHN